MAKARYKPEELTRQSEPAVAVLPSEQPVSPFLDPSVAQAEPQGSELYNLGTVQQRAASTRDADMYMPSYLQAPRNYPTGAEGSATRPEGASPMLYPSQAEAQPRVRARYKPEEALAIAEANRPKRYSPDQMLDVAAESMFDASQQPLPKELWKAATQRRAEMVKDGRLPMEFGQIDSLKDGIVWAANSLYGVGSYLVSAPIAAATSYAASPVESQRQMHATAAATVKRLSTEFGLQTYQDIFNLTHEPKYRVKETGQFVAVNKTGLPLMLPAASGGNNVISGDGIINPVIPEAGMRQFAKEGMTLVPTTEQDLEDYRYGQYLDRMGIGAQSIDDMKAKAPPELLAALASGNWDSVEPNQAQAELALLAAQAAIPAGGAARTWGVGRRVAAGISKAAEKVEAIAGFPVDVDTALRAKFVKAVTSGTGADAVAQKTAMQAAIDAGKTTAKVGGAYGVAAGVSSFEGTPSEIKNLAWTAANLYSGYKGGMYVARQLRSASGFTKTVLKEVADPSRGFDAGARAAVAANPAVPQSVREVLESPSRYRAIESTPARLAKNPELSPTSRAVFDKLSDYRFVQTTRLARDTAAGVPKGITLNAPFIAGALASDDPERAGQMVAAGGLFGAVGGAASRFTEANMRRGEEATSDIARMLVDIQAGNELGSGLGGEIMRNRVRPGTKFQDGERGFVMPEQEVASFLTEMEMAGADVSAFVQGKSFDELAQWAAYQGFFRDKVDLVPLNARDYKLNAEAAGQNGSGAYFLQPSEGRRARIFVNAESRRDGLAPHEYGHAVLRGGALSPDQIDAVHADINGRYTPDALKAMAGEYAAGMVRAENVKAGIEIEPSPAAIEAKATELTQGSMIKGSADGLDWLREEIFAEEFRNANIDFARARRNIPLGANPVSFMENLLGAQSRALHMAGIDIDPQTGKPMGRDQIFKENRVAAGDPVVMKNYKAYVRQWRQWIKDPTHEIDPGVAVSKTGNVQDTANNPNVTWRNYGGGRLENEFGVKNPDGTVTPKDWNEDIKPTVRARQQAVREMSNRSKQVASADDPTFGMRTRRDGRKEVSGRVLPDSFFYIPQYKPFHSDIRKIVTADGAGETLQVRYYAKGKSKDIFKDGINGVNAVNREAMHGNFVAKKDGTLMWGYLDMTQFRNRAMKAIADRNPALEPYNWDFKALMDDVPTHLRDQASGRGGAVTVGPERANVLNGLIGIGTGPLVGAFGKGTAYKTIHLDSIDAVVPTGKQGGQFDVYRANRNAMPDDPKPPVDMTTDLTPDNNNRMPSALPQSGMAMPEVPANLSTDQILRELEENQGYLGLSTLGMREGRPVKGGAQQTRELLKRNTALNEELRRRGGPQEESDVERVLRQRGQAMPDADYMDAVQRGDENAARKIMEDAAKPSLFFEHVTKGKVRPFWHHKRTAEDFTTFRTPAWFSKNKEYVQELKGPIDYKPADLEASRPYFLTPDIIDKGSFKDHRVLSIDGVDLARTAWKGKTWEEKLPFIELPDRDQVYPFHDWQYGEGVLEQPGVMDAIKEQGYQIIHIKERGFDTYAVLDASIIKPADAVLRDQAGNVVPPSKRFATGGTRGQAMPDVGDVSSGLPRRSMESRGGTQIADDGTITYKGKEPSDWTPEEFAAFGKEFGVGNLGPLSKVTRITDDVGRDIASIPGGLDGEFTYYDLLWLKANPVDVASLPVELHGKLTAKLARTMTPEPGNKVQKFNGIVFGFLSANAPLLPNEMGQARLRFGSMKEIADFGNLLPDNPTPEQMADVNTKLKKELGFSAADAGGMGIGLSQDLSNVVVAAKLFTKNPDFFIKRGDESWGAFVDKVSTQLRGLGTKTASFGSVWQDPLMAAISAMDRHMSRVFSKELLTNPTMKQRFEGIVVKRFNSGLESAKKVAKSYEGKIKRAKNDEARAELIAEQDSELAKLPDPRAAKAKTIDDVLAQAERFGQQRVQDFINEAAFSAMGTRKGKYMTAKGEVNPNVPESLQGVQWVETPRDFQVMSDAYRAALELNEARAKDIGVEVFPAQWTLWDRIRQRVEPHEAMFPGLEKLPALNDRQLGRAFEANKAAGYMTTPEQGKTWRRQSGVSPASLAYFTPAVLAAGAAVSAMEEQ